MNQIVTITITIMFQSEMIIQKIIILKQKDVKKEKSQKGKCSFRSWSHPSSFLFLFSFFFFF